MKKIEKRLIQIFKNQDGRTEHHLHPREVKFVLDALAKRPDLATKDFSCRRMALFFEGTPQYPILLLAAGGALRSEIETVHAICPQAIMDGTCPSPAFLAGLLAQTKVRSKTLLFFVTSVPYFMAHQGDHVLLEKLLDFVVWRPFISEESIFHKTIRTIRQLFLVNPRCADGDALNQILDRCHELPDDILYNIGQSVAGNSPGGTLERRFSLTGHSAALLARWILPNNALSGFVGCWDGYEDSDSFCVLLNALASLLQQPNCILYGIALGLPSKILSESREARQALKRMVRCGRNSSSLEHFELYFLRHDRLGRNTYSNDNLAMEAIAQGLTETTTGNPSSGSLLSLTINKFILTRSKSLAWLLTNAHASKKLFLRSFALNGPLVPPDNLSCLEEVHMAGCIMPRHLIQAIVRLLARSAPALKHFTFEPNGSARVDATLPLLGLLEQATKLEELTLSQVIQVDPVPFCNALRSNRSLRKLEMDPGTQALVLLMRHCLCQMLESGNMTLQQVTCGEAGTDMFGKMQFYLELNQLGRDRVRDLCTMEQLVPILRGVATTTFGCNDKEVGLLYGLLRENPALWATAAAEAATNKRAANGHPTRKWKRLRRPRSS
ncbi:expressed unknown protein [Seminavis robusta]|uniref:Uncharacterized protein n=1 Tax=Seminavis robusta TaxID=568900 RepID=A0A9N8HA90_9STRA|nr:expressed unknown protein [Seminavis robusta]|eukprot:Sro140_g065470.1 n/a (611) ;mRNA; r:48194-50026